MRALCVSLVVSVASASRPTASCGPAEVQTWNGVRLDPPPGSDVVAVSGTAFGDGLRVLFLVLLVLFLSRACERVEATATDDCASRMWCSNGPEEPPFWSHRCAVIWLHDDSIQRIRICNAHCLQSSVANWKVPMQGLHPIRQSQPTARARHAYLA